MHEHVVEIPEVDVRQVLRQDVLNFEIELLAGVLIDLGFCLIDEGVDAGVGVVAAVGAVRRELRGVESVFEDVGVLVAADLA